MDGQDPRTALAEVERRGRQTERRLRLPWWGVAGTGLALLATSAANDLDRSLRWVVDVAILAGLLAIGVAVERHAAVKPRCAGWPVTRLALLAVAACAAGIAVGTVLRGHDIALDGTLSGIATAVVWWAGAPLVTRVTRPDRG